MKYLALDVETLGLDPNKDNLLSIGMIVEDTEKDTPIEDLPRLHIYLTEKYLVGDIRAIVMNDTILKRIDLFHIFGLKEEGIEYLSMAEAYTVIINFIDLHFKDKVFIAGKNPNFDINFLRANFEKLALRFHKRVLDPAILYLEKDDVEVPNLQTCLDRSGIKTKVSHDAIKDAEDVIKLIRFKL